MADRFLARGPRRRPSSATFGLAVANVLALWRRFLGLAVLIVLGVTVCLSVLTVSSAAQQRTRAHGTEGVALRAIELTTFADRPELKRLTIANLRAVRALPGVQAVEPTVQASFGIKTAAIPGALLYGHVMQPSRPPPLVKRARAAVFPLQSGEAVVPAVVQGLDLSSLLGKSVPVEIQRTTGPGSGTGEQSTVRVVGLIDPGWQVDGPASAYVAADPLINWVAARESQPADRLLTERGYDGALVVAGRSADLNGLLRTLQDEQFAASSLSQQLQQLPSVLKLLDSAARVLLCALVLMLAFSSATVSAALVRQRTHEVGILTAIGFTGGRVLRALVLEMALVAAGSAALAVVLSVPGALAVATLTRSSAGSDVVPNGLLAPPAGLTVGVGIGVVLAVLAGALLPLLRSARMEPAQALRDW